MDWRPFVFGGAASMFAEFVTYPIDTTKTRLQIQGQKFTPSSSTSAAQFTFKGGRYNGMLHAIRVILLHEGLSPLYKGLNAALLRQATYGTIKMGIYNELKRHLKLTHGIEESLATNVCCGLIAGVTSSAIANPTDVLKIRMQAMRDGRQNRGLFLEFRDIISKEGVSGLYRAVGPTASRAAIVVGVELPAYDSCKSLLIRRNLMSDGPICHFSSSFVAGFFGAVISSPIDVIKTRLMNSSKCVSQSSVALHNEISYSGVFDCAIKTVRNEGALALWKGFVPNWLRLGPWNIVFFVVFEQTKKLPF